MMLSRKSHDYITVVQAYFVMSLLYHTSHPSNPCTVAGLRILGSTQ